MQHKINFFFLKKRKSSDIEREVLVSNLLNRLRDTYEEILKLEDVVPEGICEMLDEVYEVFSHYFIIINNKKIYHMGHAATKPDKVNIGITENFRDQNLVM